MVSAYRSANTSPEDELETRNRESSSRRYTPANPLSVAVISRWQILKVRRAMDYSSALRPEGDRAYFPITVFAELMLSKRS